MPLETQKTSTVICLIFYLFGVCSLLPWNFLITADSFWQHKLRNTSLGDNGTADGQLTKLQIAFTPTLVVLSNVLTLIFTLVTSAFTLQYNDQWRIFGAFIFNILAMIGITILSIINTDSWQELFFGLTMFFISLLNVGNAIFQASLYGLAGIFGEQVVTAFFSGQAISGVVSSFAMIVALAIGRTNPTISGIVYFAMADLIIVASLVAYVYLIKMREYELIKSRISSSANPQSGFTKENYKDLRKVFLKIKWLVFSSATIFLVTLTVFPSVQVYVTSSLPSSAWTNIYYQATFTFLVFNVFDVVGREVTRCLKWPSKDSWMMPILTIARIIFIPLILLCNGDSKTFPTVFYNDAFYFIFNSLFAFTNGYLLTLILIYYSSFVKDTEVELAGTILASGMGIGLAIGSAVSPGLVALWGP